jgi:hypothetical protein
MIGWIAIHRKLLDSPLWTSRGRFSPGQAWIDLLLSAAHADHECHLGNLKIVEKRGQFLTSQLALSKRWKWNRKTVVGFLLFLKTDNALDIQTSRAQDSGYTLITILNYDHYQSLTNGVPDNRKEEDTDNRADNRGTTEGQPRDTHNNGNKGNKKEHRALPAGFADLWACHPGPKGPKAEAVKAFVDVHPPENVVALLRTQVEYKAACDKSGVFCAQFPHLFRWLKKRRWEDEVPTNGNRPGQDVSKYPLL